MSDVFSLSPMHFYVITKDTFLRRTFDCGNLTFEHSGVPSLQKLFRIPWDLATGSSSVLTCQASAEIGP